jgi:hypothetical protein
MDSPDSSPTAVENKRLSYRAQVDLITRLNQPTGASRTARAKTSHVDQELRDSLRHQQEFDNYVKKEFNRLNFPIDYYRPASLSPTKSPAARKTVSPKEKSIPNTRRTQRTNTVPVYSPEAEVTMNHRRLKTAMMFNQNDSSEQLPPLIKSTPMHLDPKYRISKRNSREVKYNSKYSQLNKVDFLIERCIDSGMKGRKRVEEKMEGAIGKSSIVYQWVERLCESARFGTTETLNGIINLHKDQTRLDKRLKEFSERITNELNEAGAKRKGKSTRRKSCEY